MAKRTKKAAAAVHPGEILGEEFLAPLGMRANRLAIELRVPAPRISGDRTRTGGDHCRDDALPARFVRTTPDFWMNLQTTYDLRMAEHQVGATVDREVSPRAARALHRWPSRLRRQRSNRSAPKSDSGALRSSFFSATSSVAAPGLAGRRDELTPSGSMGTHRGDERAPKNNDRNGADGAVVVGPVV